MSPIASSITVTSEKPGGMERGECYVAAGRNAYPKTANIGGRQWMRGERVKG